MRAITEYSPESFTGTEVDYALDVCNAVLDVWQPTAERKAIINLPSTVQLSMPHVYGMQIAYMDQHLKYRDSVILLEQIRTLDKARLRERMGKLDENTMTAVDNALAVSFGLHN